MKRIVAVFLCVFLIAASMVNAVAENQYIITLPPWIDDEEYDPSVTEEGMGMKFVEYDEDGNLLFTISETARSEVFAQVEESWAETVDSMVNDETGFLAVSSVEHNEDYSEINVFMEKDEVGFEAMMAMVLPIISWEQQLMLGYTPEQYACNIAFYDTNNEPVETIVVHDAELQELVKSLEENSDTTEDTEEETENMEDVAVSEETSSIAEFSALEDGTFDSESVLMDDVCEIQFAEYQIAEKIVPKNTDGYYSYYEAENGKQYIDICFSYMNLATKAVTEQDIVDGLLLYDGRYEYSGFGVVENEGRSNFDIYCSIDPLCMEYVHYLFEVPNVVVDGGGSIEAILTIHEKEFKVIIR